MRVIIFLLITGSFFVVQGKYVLEKSSIQYANCNIRVFYEIRPTTKKDMEVKLDLIKAKQFNREFLESVIHYCPNPVQKPELPETGLIIPDNQFDNVVYVQTENGFYALWLYELIKKGVLSPIPPKAVASLGGLGKKGSPI